LASPRGSNAPRVSPPGGWSGAGAARAGLAGPVGSRSPFGWPR